MQWLLRQLSDDKIVGRFTTPDPPRGKRLILEDAFVCGDGVVGSIVRFEDIAPGEPNLRWGDNLGYYDPPT